MAYPKWVLKYKTKGTEVRCVKGKYYYLYKITSKWNKEKGRAVKVTEKYLGRITKEDGLVPKGQRAKRDAPKAPVRIREYGATQTLTHVGHDIIQALQEHFPADWKTIYTLSMIKLLHQAPLKNMEFWYHSSHLSDLYKDLNLSKNALTSFMRSLGNQGEPLLAFKKEFMKGSEHTVFDVTEVVSQSKKMDLNHQGYNSKRQFDPQINYLYFFSVDKQMPGYYRILPGNISGVKALKLTIDEAELKNCTVVADKGFTSEANLKKLENEGLQYVLPLRRNSSYVNVSKLKFRDYDKAFDGHFIHFGRPIFYYRYKRKGRKCVMFFDEQLRQQEAKDYLVRIKDKCEGYTMEGYRDKQLGFGTLLVVTNLSHISAERIYVLYKSRMQIESLFDTLKNTLAADVSYMQSNESFQAWAFINHIALLLYYRLFALLKKAELLQKYSPKDIIQRLTVIKKVQIKKSWHTSEINSKTEKILKAMGLPIP